MSADFSRRRFVLAAGSFVVSGCTAPSLGTGDNPTPLPGTDTPPLPHDPPAYDPEWESPTDSPLSTPVSPTVLVKNLEIPWDLDFTPDGDMFITERVGRIRRFDGDDITTVATPADAIDAESIAPGSDESPWWVEGGEGGVLGIAVHPNYPEPSYIYVYYTAQTRGGKENRLVRFDPEADDPATTQTPIVTGIPAEEVHNGGRVAFGPENYLWVTTGDAEMGERTHAYPQDLGSLAGKILRMRTNGEAAPGNPDLGSDADPRIVSYGHRNPQGISWLPDGTTITSEHGQGGHDEVNVIEPGANYGWPDVRAAEEYRANPAIHPPLLSTTGTTWAPTGSVFYTGDALSGWRNRFIIGGLVSQQIIVVTLTPPDGEFPPTDAPGATRHDAEWLDTSSFVATSHPTLQDALGRVRLVTQSPDGELYAITSNRDGRASGEFPREDDDVLVRLDPA